MTEMEALRARVENLENASLRTSTATPVRGGRGRTVASVVLIVVALLLAPIAAIGTWARLALVDTDRFVETFAPLAEEPAVQALVADEVAAAINEQVDVAALVGDIIDGVRELGLPPRADAAIGLLEGPAAQGLQSLIENTVEQVVASPAFANVWEQALRVTHERAIRVIQGSPDTVLELSQDGVLSVRLNAVAAAVKAELAERGMRIADAIPEIDRNIPILQADSLVTVRTVYNTAVAAGYWLSWVVLGLLILGVGVARRPLRALMWTSAGFALAFVLLMSGLGVGRVFFTRAVSPSVMPAAAAETLFEQSTMFLLSASVALALLGALVAAWCWLAGPARPARAVREVVNRGFTGLRAAGDRRGVSTGGFGELVERWRSAIFVVTAAIGALIIFVNRPPTVASVVGVLLGIAAVFLIVELIRRPSQEPVPDESDAADPTATVGAETADGTGKGGRTR